MPAVAGTTTRSAAAAAAMPGPYILRAPTARMRATARIQGWWAAAAVPALRVVAVWGRTLHRRWLNRGTPQGRGRELSALHTPFLPAAMVPASDRRQGTLPYRLGPAPRHRRCRSPSCTLVGRQLRRATACPPLQATACPPLQASGRVQASADCLGARCTRQATTAVQSVPGLPIGVTWGCSTTRPGQSLGCWGGTSPGQVPAQPPATVPACSCSCPRP